MTSVNSIILRTLKNNLNYHNGEKVLIIQQVWSKQLGKETKNNFDISHQVCRAMFEVYQKAGIEVGLLSYTPSVARNGVDVPKGVYDLVFEDHPSIVFMPTAYSLTHTPFTKQLLKRGSRVASMPGFTLNMFAPNGPMCANPQELAKRGKQIYLKLKRSKFVHITGRKTDLIVEVDSKIVHPGETGIIAKPEDLANLPAGEVCCVPKHLGKSNGYLTVPKGWGGPFPLKYELTFHIKNGRFVNIESSDARAKTYIKEKIAPLVFEGKNFDILAELGIGTNHKIDAAYIKKHGWSALTAEKIIGSAHFANGCSAGLGGKNDVPVHIDWVVPEVKIEFGYIPN